MIKQWGSNEYMNIKTQNSQRIEIRGSRGSQEQEAEATALVVFSPKKRVDLRKREKIMSQMLLSKGV